MYNIYLNTSGVKKVKADYFIFNAHSWIIFMDKFEEQVFTIALEDVSCVEKTDD